MIDSQRRDVDREIRAMEAGRAQIHAERASADRKAQEHQKRKATYTEKPETEDSEESSDLSTARRDGKPVHGMNGSQREVWTANAGDAEHSLWIKVFSCDEEHVLQGWIDLSEDGVRVRVIVDEGQLQNYGTREAMKRLRAAGVAVRTGKGPLLTWNAEKKEYDVVEEDREGEPRVYRGHAHYKYVIIDVEVPQGKKWKDHNDLVWTLEHPNRGVVSGSYNPTKYSQASKKDSATLTTRKKTVRAYCVDYQESWAEAKVFDPAAWTTEAVAAKARGRSSASSEARSRSGSRSRSKPRAKVEPDEDQTVVYSGKKSNSGADPKPPKDMRKRVAGEVWEPPTGMLLRGGGGLERVRS